MIPKVIHYCWFGGNEKSELFKKCIKSWKKFCPDYTIIEWNENNFDIHMTQYVSEAYENKKWAFVSDYARLWIIYQNGGIYLDTDVELIRSPDDLLKNKAFFGYENIGYEEDNKYINTGIGFGAEKENPLVARMLKEYDNVPFVKENKELDLTPCPIRNTHALSDLIADKIINDKKPLELEDGVIYPSEYFCPLDARGINMNKTENTYSIHWYSASWLSEDEQIVHQYRLLMEKSKKRFGDTLGRFLVRVLYLFLPRKRKVLKRM